MDWIETLKQANIKVSMDGKGRWMDNVFIERLWRSMKYECIYLNELNGGRGARQKIGQWIEIYNQEQPHLAIDGKTPDMIFLVKSVLAQTEQKAE